MNVQLDQDDILKAIGVVMGESDREFDKRLNEIREQIDLIWEHKNAEADVRLVLREDGIIEDVIGKLREERLDLKEELFAAKHRYEGLMVSLQAGLAGIRNGEPGPPGERGEQGQQGLSGLSFRIRGTWIEINEYRALDVVALGGASFAAKRDDPGPCPGDGWQLIAAQGKRGHQGEQGLEGAKGDRGEPGLPVVALTVSDEGALTLTNGDGSVVTCDLYPVLAKVAR